MPFVNEKIPENLLKTINFDVFRGMRGGAGSAQLEGYLTRDWTRDAIRDAFLITVGASGGGYDQTVRRVTLALWWKGDIIYFVGEPLHYRDEECRVHSWKNVLIEIPPSLEYKRDAFIKLLKESLIACYSYTSPNPENCNKVICNF